MIVLACCLVIATTRPVRMKPTQLNRLATPADCSVLLPPGALVHPSGVSTSRRFGRALAAIAAVSSDIAAATTAIAAATTAESNGTFISASTTAAAAASIAAAAASPPLLMTAASRGRRRTSVPLHLVSAVVDGTPVEEFDLFVRNRRRLHVLHREVFRFLGEGDQLFPLALSGCKRLAQDAGHPAQGNAHGLKQDAIVHEPADRSCETEVKGRDVGDQHKQEADLQPRVNELVRFRGRCLG